MASLRTDKNGLFADADLPNSLWTATAIPLEKQPALIESTHSDVVIVGAGFTGLRTAIGAAEAGAKVSVIEAKVVGFGASGRSGGQVNPVLHLTPDALRKKIGAGHSEKLIAATLQSGSDLFAEIERFQIDCDAVAKGWLQVAPTSKRLKTLEHIFAAWNAEGGRIELIDGQEVERRSGSPIYKGGLFHPNAGHVHPLSLVRGFAQTAIRLGVNIYENSPVLGMAQDGNLWRLRTPEGQITAGQVVITTNGYSDDLWPGLKQEILPLVSVIAATKPLTPKQRDQVLPQGTTIADNRRSITYGRYTRQGRLAIGCLGSDPEKPDFLGAFKRLRRRVERVFPVLSGIGWDYSWGGRIAVTHDLLPKLHEPAPGVLIGLGFNGRGVAMSSVMGRALAARLNGASRSSAPFPTLPVTTLPWHRLKSALLPLSASVLSMCDNLEANFDD